MGEGFCPSPGSTTDQSTLNIDFAGKTVVVTGAAHGIGRAISVAFAARGAKVWACDILGEELANTRQACEPGQCETRAVDVGDPRSVSAFFAEVTADGSGVDVLVNNAGGVRGQVGRPLEEVTPDEWRAIFAANVDGAFYCSQAVTPGMKRTRNGRIINISSGAGLGVTLTGIQAYAAAKAALINLSRQLAHELGAWSITVNSIAPGFILSNPATLRQWESYGSEGQRELIERIALKRLGTPEDIAHGVLFLASDYASWITGQVLSIDGGK
jgi:3-oxoacyl-[acyl-carrier protein] reductase